MKIDGIYQSPKGSVLVLSEPLLTALPGDYLKIENRVYQIRNFGLGDKQSVLLFQTIDDSLYGLEVEVLSSIRN